MYNLCNTYPGAGTEFTMQLKHLPLFLAAFCVAVPLAYSQTPPAGAKASSSVVEEIVARVNGAIITRNELGKAREQMLQEVRERGGNDNQEVAKREKDLLRDLIDQQLLLQKGQDLGITGDTELIKRLDEIRKSMNLDSMEALEKAAQAQGVSYEDFKQNLKNNIITQAVIGREVGSRIQVSAEEEKKFYDEHQKELERPEQVRLSEILIAPKPPQQQQAGDKKDETSADPTPEEVAAAQRKAEEALAEIKKGAKFEDVAKSVSNGPTAADGGDLGYFRRGTLAKELEDVTFNMKPGSVSDVIRTKQGFVILKVNEHQQAGIPPIKDVQPDIQQAIYLKKLQPALREYLTKLREEAYIDIKPAFVDSGASPNETKPVYVASTTGTDSPDKDKPKKKKKFLIF